MCTYMYVTTIYINTYMDKLMRLTTPRVVFYHIIETTLSRYNIRLTILLAGWIYTEIYENQYNKDVTEIFFLTFSTISF